MSVECLPLRLAPLSTGEPKAENKIATIFEKSSTQLKLEFINIAYLEAIPKQRKPVGPFGHFCLNDKAILSDAPDEVSVDPFLKMTYDHADAVIMLIKPEECSIPKLSAPYFGDPGLGTQNYSVVRKDLKHLSNEIDESILEITDIKTKEKKSIPHFHYSSWQDGTAGSPKTIAALARISLIFKRTLIHCLAGEGRSGTLATTISAYKSILGGNDSPYVIRDALISLRQERKKCVHTPEQYQSIYKAVKTLLQEDGFLPQETSHVS